VTTGTPRRVVVTDANILINFLSMSRLDLLGKLPGYEFVVPEHVDAEILRKGQRLALDKAFRDGTLRREVITDLAAIGMFADLSQMMGQGEASCIALAGQMGWLVACDEKGVVRRKIDEVLGSGRLVTTPGIMVLAIRAGLLDVEEADRLKGILAKHRFRMKFASFREVAERTDRRSPEPEQGGDSHG